jgi:hypothetical protein
MDRDTHPHLADDHAFPMGFIILPACVGALLWLLTMLSRFTQP